MKAPLQHMGLANFLEKLHALGVLELSDVLELELADAGLGKDS